MTRAWTLLVSTVLGAVAGIALFVGWLLTALGARLWIWAAVGAVTGLVVGVTTVLRP